ncbi:hypothetical protein MNV49_000735 [Pseudohyphozyma bogoriensis]|nr:hypothetical protein MNV49_000735 [Pseudohyphozyma bogoriensis]
MTLSNNSDSVLLRLSPLDLILETGAICVGYVLAPSSDSTTPIDIERIDTAMGRVADKWRLIAGRTEWISKDKIWGIRAPLGPLPHSYATHTFTSTTLSTPAPFPVPSFTPSSATYFTQPPRQYFVHPKTPNGNKSYSTAPLISIHVTVFSDCVCVGMSYPHGVFDGVGIGHVLKALDAEMNRTSWVVPELGETNVISSFVAGSASQPDKALRCKHYALQGLWGIAAFLGSMGFQWAWHGVEHGGIFVGREVVEIIVGRVKEEVREQSGGKEYVSTGDVMLAWALKAMYLDEPNSPNTLKAAQSVSARPLLADAAGDSSFNAYPHNAVLMADLASLPLSSLPSTPLSTLALSSRHSILRTRTLPRATLDVSSPTGAILPLREWGTDWIGFSSQVEGGYESVGWGDGWEIRSMIGYPLPVNADHLLFVNKLEGGLLFTGDLRKSRWAAMEGELRRLESGEKPRAF